MMTSKDKLRFEWLDKVAEGLEVEHVLQESELDVRSLEFSELLDGERRPDIGGYGE